MHRPDQFPSKCPNRKFLKYQPMTPNGSPFQGVDLRSREGVRSYREVEVRRNEVSNFQSYLCSGSYQLPGPSNAVPFGVWKLGFVGQGYTCLSLWKLKQKVHWNVQVRYFRPPCPRDFQQAPSMGPYLL